MEEVTPNSKKSILHKIKNDINMIYILLKHVYTDTRPEI